MRDKLNQFMQGRYGNDDLNRFLMKIILAAFVLSLFTGRIVFGGVVSLSRIFYWIALALLIYCYIDVYKRQILSSAESRIPEETKYFGICDGWKRTSGLEDRE